MFSYTFFQNGFIFCSLVAGLSCLCHNLFCNVRPCKNYLLMSTVIFTGLCHALFCAYMLDTSQNSVSQQFLRGGAPQCVDFTLTATIANAVVLTVICHSVVRLNFTPTLFTWLLEGVAVLCVFTGLVKTLGHKTEDQDKTYVHLQETFMTIMSESGSRTDVFLTLCLKKVSTEGSHLVLEYALIFCPLLVTVLAGLCKANAGTNRFAVTKLKIIDDGCFYEEGQSCVCSKLNPAFVSILLYSFLLLFIARPAMIVYSSMTSGVFRDLFPGLTNTVLYCFLCGEYLIRLTRNARTNRHKLENGKVTQSCDIRLVQYL